MLVIVFEACPSLRQGTPISTTPLHQACKRDAILSFDECDQSNSAYAIKLISVVKNAVRKNEDFGPNYKAL